MEWSDVRIFLAIARAGTLGAAARNLGQTQPTMGRRLKALETALGRKLFQRTRDGFVLTDEGLLMMGHAERMEEEALTLERQLVGSETELEGALRLSSSDWFGLHVLAPILADFSRAHPRVVVELLTESRFSNLSRREADMVFRIQPFTEPEVVSRKFVHITYGLYARGGNAVPTFGDGRGFRVVTMDEAYAGMPDVTWLHECFPNAEVAMRSNNREVQAALCAAGVGMAVLPNMLAAKIKHLKRIDRDRQPPGRDTWVGYHPQLENSGVPLADHVIRAGVCSFLLISHEA